MKKEVLDEYKIDSESRVAQKEWTIFFKLK